MTRWLLRELPRLRRALALPVALGLGHAAAVVVQWAMLSHLVSAVFLGGAGLGASWPALSLFLIAGGARAALAGGRETAAARVALGAKPELRARLFAHLEQLGPAYCAGERTGE